MRPSKRPSKKFKIVEDDLSEDNDWGQTSKVGSQFYEIIIEQKHPNERARLDTLIHEALHVADWKMSERKVIAMASVLTTALWRQGYRRRNSQNK